MDIEAKIVKVVVMAARRGVGLTVKQVLNRTSILCKRLNIGSTFKSFKAGKDWWAGVKRRHPEITIRKPERLTSTRSRMMNKEVVDKYFQDLGTLLEGLSLEQRSHCIWNCDEMSKNFEHNPVKVVAAKGETCVSKTSNKSTNITVMACIGASGKRMPPMFVVKGKTARSLHGFDTTAAPKNSVFGFQTNGWMDDTLGEQWFQDVFLKNCGTDRPQLLILDGHSSHETLGLLMRAMEENIHILSLPPHTTHYLQPLDRAVFGPLNKKYNQLCSEYLQENPLNKINKWTFFGLFNKAWDVSLTPSNIASGFRSCGIYPFCRQAIPEVAFAPSEPTNRPLPQEQGDKESDKSADASTSISEPTDAGTEQQPMVDTHVEALPELDLSTTSILDIGDPNDLLQLIAGGEMMIDPLVDEHGNQIIVDPSSVSSTVEPSNRPPADLAGSSIDNVLDEMFLPAKLSANQTNSRSTSVQTARKSTSHRLLTSSEVIDQKIMMMKVKAEKDNKRISKHKNKQ